MGLLDCVPAWLPTMLTYPRTRVWRPKFADGLKARGCEMVRAAGDTPLVRSTKSSEGAKGSWGATQLWFDAARQSLARSRNLTT